jgi:hypothetical protein
MTFVWWHVPVALIPMLPTFWSIWHILHHEFEDATRRSLWLALTVFLPVLGGVIYIIRGSKKALRKIQ